MSGKKKQPPRLAEALQIIGRHGNLIPMEDVTTAQLDRLWDWIDTNGLATMNVRGTWALTEAGNEAGATDA